MLVDTQRSESRIVISRDVCHEKPRVAGTRVMVYQVLDLLAAGKTPIEITSDDYFPDLDIQDVLACIGYASQIIRNEDVVPVVA